MLAAYGLSRSLLSHSFMHLPQDALQDLTQGPRSILLCTARTLRPQQFHVEAAGLADRDLPIEQSAEAGQNQFG